LHEYPSAHLFSNELDVEAIAHAELFDRKLVLLASADHLSTQRIVERYRALADIEDAFAS
jgi:hypothetical protein